MSKNKNMRDMLRGIMVCKWGYLLRSSLLNSENGDPLADSNKVLNRWKNYFSELLVLYVFRISDILQREIHTAESLYLILPLLTFKLLLQN
jgi:hypothetical protein